MCQRHDWLLPTSYIRWDKQVLPCLNVYVSYVKLHVHVNKTTHPVFMCMCVCVSRAHVYSCVCTCGGERKMPDVFLCSFLPYSLKTGSLTELEAHYLAREAGRWAPKSYFSLPLLGPQAFVAMPSFLCEVWAFEGSSSCLHSKCSYPLTCLLSPHPVSSKEPLKTQYF